MVIFSLTLPEDLLTSVMSLSPDTSDTLLKYPFQYFQLFAAPSAFLLPCQYDS